MKRMKIDEAAMFFQFQNLPPEMFVMILDFLDLEDKKNMRQLSTWFEKRLTLMLSSIFGTFIITIRHGFYRGNYIEFDLDTTLSRAMAKPLLKNTMLELKLMSELDTTIKSMITTHIQNITVLSIKGNAHEVDFFMNLRFKEDIKLELKFQSKLNPNIKKMITNFKDNIISLHVEIHDEDKSNLMDDDEYLFMDVLTHDKDLKYFRNPSLNFPSLESLSIDSKCWDYQREIIEVLVSKHASKLKNLKIVSDNNADAHELTVPALPLLETLDVTYFCAEGAWSLIQASRLSLTSFSMVRISFFDENSPQDETLIYLPELKHLSFGFVEHLPKILKVNAVNLTSLKIGSIRTTTEFPEFPKLRELHFWGSKSLPLLHKCKETLEHLVYEGLENPPHAETLAVVMPKLTDFHLHLNQDVDWNPSDFIKVNMQRLEFLYLNPKSKKSFLSIEDLDKNVKMMKMKTVIMKNKYCFDDTPSTFENKCFTDKDRKIMTALCPNADVFVCNMQDDTDVKSVNNRLKKKGFKRDLSFV